MCAEDHVFVFLRVINMDELLEEAKHLPPVKARAVAAVLGAVVANAAGNSLGLISYCFMSLAIQHSHSIGFTTT